MDPDIINSIGLSLDIAGVILMFIYGLPAGIAHEGDAAGMRWAPPDDEVERESKRWGRYKLLARLGLVLLVAGFVLQIASNHIGVRAPITLPAVPCPL